MQLVRYNPWRDFTRHESDLDMAFREAWDWPMPPVLQDPAAVDMYTENGKLLVEVTLPGFTKEEVRLNTSTFALDITAEHKEKEEKNVSREYLLHESSHNYHRLINLPEGANTDAAEATYVDNKLMIAVPMERQQKSKEVAIH